MASKVSLEYLIHISILIVSLIIITVSVYWAGIDGNIVHMENGREPDAGVTLIPYVIVPMFFYGVSFLGKWAFGASGWYIIFIFLAVFLLYTAVCLPKDIKKYKRLITEREANK